MATDTIWKQALTATGSGTDAPNWTLGLEGSAHAEIGACSVTAFWWSPPAGATGTVGWRIYSGHIGESHSLLASGNLPSYTAGGGWQRFAITPQDVTGINFLACLYTSPHGDYAYKTSPGFPVDDGILVSAQSGFKEAADAAPDLSSALSYMFDFELTYGGGAVDVDDDDSAALTDVGTVAAASASSDSGALTDAGALAVAAPGSDSATLTEAGATDAAAPGSDSAALADTGQATAQLGLVDSATFSDASTLAGGPAGTDSAALSESSVVAVVAVGVDAGTMHEVGVVDTGATTAPALGGTATVIGLGGTATVIGLGGTATLV